MIYIIEGNTGAGKTTFVNSLKGFEVRKTNLNTLEEIKETLSKIKGDVVFDKLFEISLGNKLQIGKSKCGHYKIYDFERAKRKITFGERKFYSDYAKPTKISWKNYLEYLQIHNLSWDELYYCDWANGEKK